MRMRIQIQEVVAGDELIDAHGRPYFRVFRNELARANDYRVLLGERLRPSGEASTPGGHRHTYVDVERRAPATRYTLKIDGTPVLSTKSFGDANHAAFDDLPGFRVLDAAEDIHRIKPDACYFLTEAITEVYNQDHVLVAAYEVSRGKFARPIESTDPRILGISHAGAGF